MLAYPEPVPPGGVVDEMLPQHHQQAGGHRPAHPQVPAHCTTSGVNPELFIPDPDPEKSSGFQSGSDPNYLTHDRKF